MKILLIYPPFINERIFSGDVAAIPMGLYHVAAMLRENGHDAQIANWHQPDMDMEMACQAITRFSPDVVGFSIVNANRFGALDLAKAVKDIDSKITTVFGGIGATFLWEHLLTHFPQMDYAVLGEGEYPMLGLINCLEKGDIDGAQKIPGLAFRKNNKPARSMQPEPIADLNALPDPSKFFKYEHVSLSRGCPNNCTFCGSPRFWGRKTRFYSADYFVSQLKALHKNGVNFFYVSDDTFTLKKDLVISVCKKIINENLGITWAAISRVDRVDPDILFQMRKAGCIQISYGVESGCEKTREFLNKNICTKDILSAFSLTTSFGMLSRAYFIYGCPGENSEVLQKNLDLMDAINPLGAVFYILDIFPGTRLYEDYKKQHNATDDVWLANMEDIMYWETDPNLNADLIKNTGDRLRNHFFENLPQYIRAIDLVDDKRLGQEHADFCSRLAMTFSQGDYSRDSRVAEADLLAKELFEKAISYYPDARAFLGLGMIRQKNGQHTESVSVLEKGAALCPENEQICMCLGVSRMNIGDFDAALECFKKYKHLPQAKNLIAQCHATKK